MRLGTEVRNARLEHAMSRRRAGLRAGVSWSTQLRVELGDPNIGLQTLCAVAEAVGLDVVLQSYPGRQPSLRDTGQLVLGEQLVKRAHASWHPTFELVVGQHTESIDLALFGPEEILAVEIERRMSDFQAQYRRAETKRQLLAERHQRPVRLVLAIEDTRRNRQAMERHDIVVETALPAGTREVFGALRSGRPLRRNGVVWVRRWSR